MTAPQPPYGGPPPESGPYPLPYPQAPYPQAQYPQSGAYQYPQPPYMPTQHGYGAPPPPPRPKSKLPWILGGIVLLVIVIGFAVAPRGGSTPTVTAASPSPDAPAAANPGSGTASGVPTWGQRATTDAGLGIEVAEPEAYKPSRSAAGNDRGRAVKVTTTVVNGTSEPYELNTFIIGPTATHAGKPASEVFDLGGDVDVVPVTTILPGKSFTYSTLLSVGKDEAEMQLEYSPELFEDPVIFVGNV